MASNTGLALRLSQLREVVGLLWSARLKWHNLGLELGIHETELKVIQANHPNDVEACFTEMLSHWLKMIQPAPSYQALVEACSRPSVKCYKLASEIAKKHDIETPKDSITGSSDSSSVELPPVDLGPYFPYLSTTNMSEKEIAHYQFKLSEETSRIKRAFAGLVHDLKKSIEGTSTIEDVLTLLKFYDKNNFEKLLCNCQTLGDVFNTLSDFVSFFDYDLLKLLAKKLGSPEVQKKFEAYKKKFQRFSKRCVCEIPQGAFGEGQGKENGSVYVIKTDDSLSLGVLTLEELKRLEYRMNRILGHLLKLLKVEDGCIQLHFLTLSQRRGGLNLSTQAQQALRKLGVLTVSCSGQMVDLTKAPVNIPESESGFYTGASETIDETEDPAPDAEKHTLSTMSPVDQYKVKDLEDPRLEMIDTADLRRKVQPSLSPLHRAAFAGDLDQLRFLIEEEKANPLDRDVNNDTLLHLVAEWGELEVLQYLIEEVGCNPATGGWYGATVLHSAARAKHLAIVKYLVEHCKMDPTNVFDELNESPLVHACGGGDLETVRYLVQRSQEMTTSMEEAVYLEHRRPKPTDRALGFTKDLRVEVHGSLVCLDDYRSEPLSAACFYGHLPIARYLVEECGCDPLRKEGERLKAPLESAVLGGHMHIVQYLASTERVRNNSYYQHNLSLVYYAALRSDIALATYLVRILGCDPNVPYIDFTPLHIAVSRNDLHMAKTLIEDLGCSPTSHGPHGQKPVHLAAFNGQVSMLKYLVEEQGCSPSATDDHGETPLYLAVGLGHFDIVCYLVNEQGCSPTYRGGEELNSPLHLAAFLGHLDILLLFMKKLDCDPNARDFQGNTLLHTASLGGNIPVIQYLIHEIGADKDTLNPQGHTPLSLAALAGNIQAVLHLLEKEGCKVRDDRSLTPLHYASGVGHLDLVKHLMQSHPELLVGISSPLIQACEEGHLEVLQYLVEKEVGGSDLNSVVDQSGSTLVHFAAIGGHVDTLRYLIYHLSCIHTRRNMVGNTPLHCAAMEDKIEVVKILSERSVGCADFFIANDKGQTPLQAAIASGSHTTALYLIVKMFYSI